MDSIVLVCVSFFLLVAGLVSLRWFRPIVPFEYAKPRPPPLVALIIGSWASITISTLIEHEIFLKQDTNTDLVLFFTRLFAFLLTTGLLHFRATRLVHPGPFTVPTFLNFVAIVSQIQALRTVSFVEFAMVKAFRIAVIALVMRQSLWYVVLSLAFAGFYYETFEPTIEGSSWLILFLFVDSFTSISQETIFKKFKINGLTMMYYINFYSVIVMLPAMYNEMFEKISRELLIYTLMLSLAVSFSQYYTLKIIKYYGAIVYVVSCTYRSLILVLPLNQQWIYFCGILLIGIIVYRHSHLNRTMSS